jgi:integrase
MLGLVWDDVDFAAGVIHVRAQLSRAHRGAPARRVAPKTPASVRDGPLVPQLARLLSAHRQRSRFAIDLGLDVAQVSRILGHARITITLDTYTHLFEDARHGRDIRTRMAASPFAGLLEPATGAPGAAVLKLP